MKKLFKTKAFILLKVIIMLLVANKPPLHSEVKAKNTTAEETKTTAAPIKDAKKIESKPAEKTNQKFSIAMVLWSGPTAIEDGFKALFKERNINAEYTIYDCKGDKKRCHDFVKEIKEKKHDLVYTWGTPAGVEIAGPYDAKDKEKEEYIWNIPIVSTIVTDPVFSKMIPSLDKPGRNLTGVNHIPPFDAQLNSMLAYMPFKKVGVFFVPSESTAVLSANNFKEACKKKGIEFTDFPYPHLLEKKLDPSRLDETFKKIKESGIDIVYMPSSNYLSVDAKIVCDAALRNGVLTFVVTELMLKNGAPLMGLMSSYTNIGRFAAEKAEAILVNKIDPKLIRYEKFEKFSFFIEMNTMRGLGVYPPLSIIDQAHFINAETSKAKSEKK